MNHFQSLKGDSMFIIKVRFLTLAVFLSILSSLRIPGDVNRRSGVM